MEVYLFHPEEFAHLYNCSAIDVQAIPFEQRQHIPISISYIVMFVIFEVFFQIITISFPYLLAMLHREHVLHLPSHGSQLL